MWYQGNQFYLERNIENCLMPPHVTVTGKDKPGIIELNFLI